MFLNESLFLDFLSDKEITWIGVDFSIAKLTKNGFDFPVEIVQRFFNEWNTLIISDQKKYDIRMAFRKPVLHYDLYAITKRNNSTKSSQMLVDHLKIENQLSDEFIIKYASALNLPEQSNFTLRFIVESFDQNSKTTSIWVVIQYVPTKEVVLCEKFLNTPRGFGTKNFWARAFYDLLFGIQKTSFLRWTNLVKPNNLIK